MTAPFVRNPYNYDMNRAGDESGLACRDPSLTQQQFVEESDINYIANRYGLTGELPQVLDLPKYGDFTGVFDFQTAQNTVRKALEQFMTLPAKLRTRFDNDPNKLLQFMEDPENRDEAEYLGLVNKRNAPTEPPPSPNVSAPPSAPPNKATGGEPPKGSQEPGAQHTT